MPITVVNWDRPRKRALGAAHIELEQAAGHTTPKGGDYMRITLHIGRYTVTIIVKSRNRHSGK